MNGKEEMPSDTDDLDSLSLSLGKRLGKLEISGVDVVEQLEVLTDRCEVMEAAVLEEHVNREKDKSIIEKLVEKFDELKNNIKVKEEESAKQTDELKAKLCKLKEDHIDLKEKFLSLVLNCQGYEEDIKRLESSNTHLIEAVKNLEKDKEKLMESLDVSKTHSSPYESLIPPLMTPVSPSSSSSSVTRQTPPQYIQPPSHVESMPTPPLVQPILFHPQYMPVYAPVPHQYMQDPYTQGFSHQEWSDQAE